MHKALVLALLAILSSCVAVALAQNSSSADADCMRLSGEGANCSTCISGGSTSSTPNLKCYWCPGAQNNSLRCRHFDFNTAIPINGIECPQLKYFVGTCTINALSIIIIIAVACVLFVVLICCLCCCCCICCAKRRQRIKMVEEERYMDEKEGIRQRSNERRAERKAKHDEIRRKYGLHHDDQAEGTYKRLD